MGNLVYFWQSYLPARDVFYFQDNNFSKSQWIFTKFDMCIDIVEMLIGKFRQFWTEVWAKLFKANDIVS